MNIELAVVFATLLGPFLAVYVTEQQRKKADVRNRKVHIFRTLMATRSARLTPAHIEALNLVEVEFDPTSRRERGVVDCWRLYLAHLNDHNYPQQSWAARAEDLLVDLLYSMSVSLDYSYDKSAIKNGTYYPKGYGDIEVESQETRRLWLEILRGQRQMPMIAEVFTKQKPFAEPAPQPKASEKATDDAG
jgi:hypothetical protein